MKRTIRTAAALLITTAPAFAGGVERAPQSLTALFEPGNYAEFSLGFVKPRVDATDVAGFKTGNVTDNYSFGSLAYKHQFNDNFSAAFIVETPFGSDIDYPLDRSVVLGGTQVEVDSTTYTAVLRYKMDNNFGFHAGIRGSRAEGDVTLRGAGYAQLSGYRAELDSAWGTGFVAGVSYERPDIAARVSLTYQSEIEHDFDTTESITPVVGGPTLVLNEGETTVKTPRSWNLEGQTGIAEGTLLFGSIRWVNWSEFKVRPTYFSSIPGLEDGLVSIDDTTTYTLGVGRKFTENWSGLAAVSYENRGDEPISPLTPTTGRKAVSLGAVYTQGPLKVTGLVSYVALGDADVGRQTPVGERIFGRAEDNHAVGFGVKVGYTF